MDSKEGPQLEVFGEGRSIYDLGFRYKVGGVTVAQSSVVGFSLPPHYSYTVLETGEKFSGNTGNAKEDYMLWKARERLMASKPAHKECSTSLNTETKQVQALPNTTAALPSLEELIRRVPSRQEEPMEIP